jgi:hypothetical protein
MPRSSRSPRVPMGAGPRSRMRGRSWRRIKTMDRMQRAVIAMKKTFAFAVALGLGGAIGAIALLVGNSRPRRLGVECVPPDLDRNSVALSCGPVGQRQGAPVQAG